ncbi:hypothetical protein RB595_010753 [Gaeumannomyces hyphopodioides]
MLDGWNHLPPSSTSALYRATMNEQPPRRRFPQSRMALACVQVRPPHGGAVRRPPPKYNTEPSPILNAEAFHHDVHDCATRASKIDEFHRLLAERKQQRLKELRDAFNKIATKIICNPSEPPDDIWWPAARFIRHPTLDHLVQLFEALLSAGCFPEIQGPPNCSAMPPFALKATPADSEPRPAPSDTRPNVEELLATPPQTSAVGHQSPKPPPQPTVQMRDAGTQTEFRVTKKKAPASRRTGAASRKSIVASSRLEDSPSAERYNLRTRTSAGVTKARERPAPTARAKRSTRG